MIPLTTMVKFLTLSYQAGFITNDQRQLLLDRFEWFLMTGGRHDKAAHSIEP
jgi:hypothetical protein